jgi:hypothetical protein
MDIFKVDLIQLLNHLMPGFLAAAIFHGFTAHAKPTPFERVVQALIFSTILQIPVFFVKKYFLPIGGSWFIDGQWSAESSLLLSVILAIAFGFMLAICANNNIPHGRCPRFVTTRTSYPSEWFHSFYINACYVYLTLKDGNRLYGWPVEFPDAVDSGHFVLTNAQWVMDDNTEQKFVENHYILVRASEVEFVELVRLPKSDSQSGFFEWCRSKFQAWISKQPESIEFGDNIQPTTANFLPRPKRKTPKKTMSSQDKDFPNWRTRTVPLNEGYNGPPRPSSPKVKPTSRAGSPTSPKNATDKNGGKGNE